LKELLSEKQICDFAASFQKTAVEILREKLEMALVEHPDVKSVVVAGGVSANEILRKALPDAYFPAPSLSGDNGAMVAAACYYEIQSGVKPTDPYKLDIYPRISIES
jgi:N6-L-threonylcarbamoyladenine synthase